MSFIKKQTAGVWATFITLVLALVSVVIYLINIGGQGYFQGAVVAEAVRFFVITIVLLVAVLALAQIKIYGMAGKIVTLVSDAMRIAVPVCTIAGLMFLISSRIEGFAFIYFSNEEVLQEVQTAANLSSSHWAIANIIALVVTAIVGMIAAFFKMKKDA